MSRAWSCLIVGVLAGCRPSLPPAPAVTAVSPTETRALEPTVLAITGGPFTLRVRADLDAPSAQEPVGAFRAALVSQTLRIDLSEVSRSSASTLTALLAAGVPGGHYALEVRDPWDRVARLEDAFVVATECVAAADCEDGFGCTTHACTANRCETALSPGFCLIEGACHVPGASPDAPCLQCDPTAHPYGWTALADGAPCDDGSLCTSGETCSSQVCGAPTASVVCTEVDACHHAGSCDPSTGQCSSPAKTNGTPCSDANACTLGESCQDGVCASPTAVVTCAATECLEAGSCDPATGACQHPERVGSCDDGYSCTASDSCQAGACRGTPTCGDTAPQACLTVDTHAAVAPATVQVDPGCSSDLETATAALLVRFDLDGDGNFDTPFEPLARRSVSLPTPGVYPLSVELQDAAGWRAAATRHVVVSAPSDDVVVTTAADEQDPGATPTVPGGTGLSLREAILWVNSGGGGRSIRFAAPMTISSAQLPPLNVAGTRIAGMPGVRIDFGRATGTCLTLAANGQLVAGLELFGCPGTAVNLDGTGGRIVDTVLRDGLGVGVTFGGSGNRLGPGVSVRGFAGVGVELRKDLNELVGLELHGNSGGGLVVAPNAPQSLVLQNRIWNNGGEGIAIAQVNAGARIWHNTVHGNAGDGVDVRFNASGVDLRNNLLTSNQGFGACGPSAVFAHENPNGVFGNAFGTYCGSAPDGGTVVEDPGYLAPARGDFRLRPDSPMTNAGALLPVDVNGASDGGFFGASPDLGAHESPY